MKQLKVHNRYFLIRGRGAVLDFERIFNIIEWNFLFNVLEKKISIGCYFILIDIYFVLKTNIMKSLLFEA